MTNKEMIRNIGFTTIPVCLVIFGLGWLLSRNIIIASILPLTVFLLSLYSNIGKFKDDIRKERAGFTQKAIKIKNAFELIAPNDSISPSLCLQLDDENCLILNGQWLYESETYGEEARKYYDEESQLFNGHLPPYAFPSSEFDLWISNLTNKPHKITVQGEYIEPMEVAWKTPEISYNQEHTFMRLSEIKK
jgi:hypothetical protein